MRLDKYIAKQLKSPTGFGGKFVFRVMGRQNRRIYEEAIRLLAPSDADSILDIGCGNGGVLHMLAGQSDCVLTGIDTSASIINTAIRRNRKDVKSGRMTLLCQDAGAMSFADQAFDKAYTINTVYFWDNLDAMMAEIGRVLKPGGLFVNTLFTNETLSGWSFTKFGYRRFTPEELVNAGIDAGLSAEVVPILRGFAYCVLYRKVG